MYQVLIVDDEAQIIHGLRKQVNWEELNMEAAYTATSGEEALAILETTGADLLIADICMPQMDGIQLITAAKNLNPGLRCVVISAFNEFEFVKSALQLGVENYLLKPINGSELYDTLVKTQANLDGDRAARNLQSPAVHVFRTNILQRWVDGSIQEFELYERAELLQIELTDPEFRVVVLDFSHAADLPDRMQLFSRWLDGCRTTMAGLHRGEFFLNAAMQVVCILHGQSLADGNAQLAAAVEQIAAQASVDQARAFASIGPVSRSFTGVHASYSAALFYLRYRYLDPVAVFIFCEPDGGPSQEPSNEPSIAVLKFENAVKDEDRQLAVRLAQAYPSAASPSSLPEMKQAMLPLILSLVRMLLESGRVSDDLPEPIVRRLAEFPHADTAEKLTNWLTTTIDEAIPVIHGRHHSYHLLVHQARQQIRQNYPEGLSLKTLASAFNVSPAYLGQLFKEETGRYFHDDLTQTRLQESQVLLIDTDLKIGEIAKRVGIPNQSYFNRIFKNEYGVSPLEYRRQSQPHGCSRSVPRRSSPEW